MILSHKEIARLTGKPAKNGKPESEVFYLRLIAGLLEQLLAKPQPEFPEIPETKPPNITVKPADVIVDRMEIPAPPPRIKKWHFALKKDIQGHTEEVIATAIE